MADPWVRFYTSDWRADPALRMCSMAARGLWIELVCLMHEATPYGHLLVNGVSPTDAQLSVLVGAPSGQIAALLGELESAGVFSRTRAGVIYSRKLTRMAKKAATARNNGRKGGNPSLCNHAQNPPPDNPHDKVRDKTQKPEARSQKELSNESSRATRLPADWVLPDDWGEWARSHGVSDFEVRRQAEMFRDYWSAKAGAGSTKRDWQATWRNWIRRQRDFTRTSKSESNDDRFARWDRMGR